MSLVRIERVGGICRLKVTLRGRDARDLAEPLPVAPPGAATTAGVLLRIEDTHETWCGSFGTDTDPNGDPDPKGSVKELSQAGVPTLLRMEGPTTRGCTVDDVCR